MTIELPLCLVTILVVELVVISILVKKKIDRIDQRFDELEKHLDTIEDLIECLEIAFDPYLRKLIEALVEDLDMDKPEIESWREVLERL